MEDTSARLRVSERGDGLVLEGADGRTRLHVATALRSRGLPVRAVGGGYVVPREAAADLLDLLPASTLWDPGVRTDAERRALAIRAHVASAQLAGDTDPEVDVMGLGLRLPLDRHQAQAATAIANPDTNGLALFDEQGTGKTFSTIAGFALLRRRGLADRMLIVAPKSVIPAWLSDLGRLLGPEVHVVAMVGDGRRRKEVIRRAHDVLVANYEAVVSSLPSLRIHLGATRHRYLLVIDESYFAKNADTKRASALWELRQLCPRAVVLSGTPAPNRPWDLVNQVHLADGGIAFGRAIRPSTPEEERRRVISGLSRAAYLRRLKTDVLPNLPKQTFTEVRVALEPEQRALYEQASAELAMDVRSVTDEEFARNLTSYLARRAALLQICSHPGAIFPLYGETPAKLRVLDDLLRSFIEVQGEKVVLWSWFRFALETLTRRYATYGVARVDGSIDSLEARADAIHRFQHDPSTRLFIGNAAAAGAGLTLTAARTSIYESLSNQAAHYMQSLDRIHRRGQERDVSYVILVAEDTVEEIEFERLIEKQRGARDLLGDTSRETPSRRVFLDELLRGLHGPDDLDTSPTSTE